MRLQTSAASSAIASLGFLLANSAVAQQAVTDVAVTVECGSTAGGGRQTCAADTSTGVALLRSTGSTACLLGNNWGYDSAGIWVSGGCSGEFALGESAAVAAGVASSTPVLNAEHPTWRDAADNYIWGEFDPGNGFLIGRSDIGTMYISGYALVRYMDQQGDDTFVDHNGTVQPVDLRRDIYSHRVLLWLRGWLGSPKLTYTITFWTVNTTDQDALFANLGWTFNDHFNLFAGVYGNPGSRSTQGSHPYWLGHDRVMADEFFRPFFTQGLYANGKVTNDGSLWYSVTYGNTNSTLGVTASQLDRSFTKGGSLWWMPTTQEFGPRGAYGDYEMHEELATRFGINYTDSPEQRYTDVGTSPQNTSLKFADSTNVFAIDALAPGVTITGVDYRIFSIDAGFKYQGFFAQAEFYSRRLDGFVADGLLPVSAVEDEGFYLQGSMFLVPRKIELYAATSQVNGDDDAGFGDSHEYIIGMNYYPVDSRNQRMNFQVIDVTRSPVSSTFGYYTGGQDGTTFSAAFSVFF
jgi:hypothetical protein